MVKQLPVKYNEIVAISNRLPPEITEPAEQARILKLIAKSMQQNPIPAGAPDFTREELHERCGRESIIISGH